MSASPKSGSWGEPPRWQVFDRAISGDEFHPLRVFGFCERCGVGDVNRWRYRYGAARVFQSAVFDGMGPKTAAGYTALTRHLLAWGAFEHYFKKLLGFKQPKLGQFLEDYPVKKWAEKVLELDPDRSLLRFVQSKVNSHHQQELGMLLGGEPFNFSYLSSAVRHLYAHGELTPGANNADAEKVSHLANRLADYLLEMQERDFEEKMRAFEER